MRKIQLQAFGGPEVLRVTDHEEPRCPRDGWLVELRAAAVNFADVVGRRGLYEREPRLPYELGKEASGVVLECGPDAPDSESGGSESNGSGPGGFAPGDRVVVVRFAGGCYAERVAALPGMLLRGPAGYDFDELAAFAVSFATAWYALHELARVRPGESLLIQAAGGALGTAALALARSHGLGPIVGTAGGREKCAWVESLGADVCVDTTRADFREVVRERTGGRGVDACLESVGGDVFLQSFEVLAELGRLVVVGFSAIDSDYRERIAAVHPLKLFHASQGLLGLNVQNLDFPRRTNVWRRLVEHLEQHDLRPQIGGRFPLEEAAAAHTALESRASRGKLLLIP